VNFNEVGEKRIKYGQVEQKLSHNTEQKNKSCQVVNATAYRMLPMKTGYVE